MEVPYQEAIELFDECIKFDEGKPVAADAKLRIAACKWHSKKTVTVLDMILFTKEVYKAIAVREYKPANKEVFSVTY